MKLSSQSSVVVKKSNQMLGKEYSLSYHCFPPFKNGFEDLDKIKTNKLTNQKQTNNQKTPQNPHKQTKHQITPTNKKPRNQTNKQNHTKKHIAKAWRISTRVTIRQIWTCQTGRVTTEEGYDAHQL